MIQYTTVKQPKIDPVIQEIVPEPEPEEVHATLEETVINDMAPIPIDVLGPRIEPVLESVHNASIY